MRDAFPALRSRPGWTYLDSAATCLLPDDVLAAVADAMAQGGSAGRGMHRAAAAAEQAYEGARAAVAQHLGAEARDVVFVASATAGLNLLAQGLAEHLLPGDALLTTALEHHSNRLPWARVASQTGARLLVAPVDAAGDLDLEALAGLLAQRPAVVAVTHVSNVTGAAVDLAAVVERVRAAAPDCAVVVDGTQAVPHEAVDVSALGVDAYVFSGHKAYGPLGAGVVWARPGLWDRLSPLLWGGGMVQQAAPPVLAERPWRFEGGTPNHVAAVGLAAGLAWCRRGEPGLAAQAAERLAAVPGCRVLGRPRRRVGIVSFAVDGVHPHDVGQLLEDAGVAVRVGHLCAQPYLLALGAGAAVRASFGAFNTAADVGTLVDAVSAAAARLGASR